jgi:uncharacterized membrane protein
MNSSIVDAAKPEFSMGWDMVLVVVPIILAAWLFTRDRRRGILWWPGLIVFILFLPNAPYALTDVLHLVFKIRKQPYLPVWAVSLIVIPEYILYIGAGLQAYTISLLLIRRYLRRHGLSRLFVPVELCLHALCAQGIFLGRRLRLNSWDMLRDPGKVLDDSFEAFDVQNWLTFVVVMFFVLLISFRILAFLNLCILESWQNRRNSAPIDLGHSPADASGHRGHHGHSSSHHQGFADGH